VVWAKSY